MGIIDGTMVKPYKPGIEARDAILREIRRREDAGEKPPTTRELAALIGRAHTTAMRHVRTLERVGLVQHVGRGRNQETHLTEAGRIATD